MKKAAIGIIFSEDRQKVLLIKRRDVPIWVLPGGGIEDGESAEKTVRRELFEETGIETSIARHVGTYLPINQLASRTEVFECLATNSQLSTSTIEALSVGYFPVKALPAPFFFLHREWVEEALQNRKEPIVREMRNINYTRLLKHIICHPLLVLRYLFSRWGLPVNTKRI